MDEEGEEEATITITTPTSRFVPSSKSHESLASLASRGGSLLSPTTPGPPPMASTSPRRLCGPQRRGKPPNILVLCADAEKREEIGTHLKGLVAPDRYAVYDIRWDQLAVGGWSEQAALLVLGGNSINPAGEAELLQFLGDGGRLLTWAWEGGPPFGPVAGSQNPNNKSVLEYGPLKKVTGPLPLSSAVWGHNFPKIVETTDSQGYSRPLTASVWARIKPSDGLGLGAPGVLQLDGGAEGGKALLSQVIIRTLN